MKINLKALLAPRQKTQATIRYVAARDLPQILYKYREIHDRNGLHLRCITKKEFYLAPPASFVDSSDCNLPVRVDLLTDDEIYNRYSRDSANMNPHFTRAQRREWTRKMAKTSPIRDLPSTQLKLEDARKKFSERFGVISMTENPENVDMWQGYAAQMQGFCIGVDPTFLEKAVGGFGKVTYYEELPIIRPFDDFGLQHVLQVYSKKTEFQFEQEFRVSKFFQGVASTLDRQVILPPEAFKKLILGPNIAVSDKQEIVRLASIHIPSASIHQAVFSQASNSIELQAL